MSDCMNAAIGLGNCLTHGFINGTLDLASEGISLVYHVSVFNYIQYILLNHHVPLCNDFGISMGTAWRGHQSRKH